MATAWGPIVSTALGYTVMQLKNYGGAWPGIDNDEDLTEYLWDHHDFTSHVFESSRRLTGSQR